MVDEYNSKVAENNKVKEENEKNKDNPNYTPLPLPNANVGENAIDKLSYNLSEPKYIPVWVSFIPYVIFAGFGIWFIVFIMRQTSDKGGKVGSFGKSRARISLPDSKNRVLFSDVAGADEEKEELKEIVDFLKDPSKYTKLGARIPHGVLLVGPPGIGKTLLAKAVAGEAGVPFFSISGSDFVELYVGVGASRVRDLFENARKHSASIIFIDEIDAVGRHRGAGLGGGHDEREQTLNQLLVEMDGFMGNSGVIVMAATNRLDILDPALLRPGRFDRQITVNRPDLNGRLEILKVHAKNKPFEKSVDLEVIAKTTIGFTGADLANLLNESALLSARRGKSLIGMDDIEDATTKIIVGTQKKSWKLSEKEKRGTAYHEGGHAIIAHVLETLDPVHQISIIPSGKALGYTLTPPQEDKFSEYKQEMLDEICMLLGGRAAEKIIFGDISGGASNDIKVATDTAHKMICIYGMSDTLGPINFSSDSGEVFLGRDFSSNPHYSGATAAKIDEEVHAIITEAYEKAINILNDNISKLHFIADYLLKHEVMNAEQFKLVMDGDPTEEDLIAISDEKKKKSAAENAERQQSEDEEKRAREEARRRAAREYRENREKSRYSDEGSDNSNQDLPH
ncbi:MAG: ATP-dependent zinc metalloprotease FtsH [Clostridia bacterium]|nr:ATP-dependent zinc metalloprotease FtsH [Clostridia bacterium]